MIHLSIPGQPLPAERPRTVRRGRSRVTITPDRTLAAMARVADAFRAAYPAGPPVTGAPLWAVQVTFYRETRATADLDNLLKTVLDGLTGPGLLWPDDRTVVSLAAERWDGVGKGQGRTVVVARPITRGHPATLVAPDTTTPEGGPA